MLPQRFAGGLPLEGLSGPSVEGCSYGSELVRPVSAQVGSFGEVLTQEAIVVLVRPALPRAVRITEVDLHVGVDAELFVLGG